jgi:hypothetical protein
LVRAGGDRAKRKWRCREEEEEEEEEEERERGNQHRRCSPAATSC